MIGVMMSKNKNKELLENKILTLPSNNIEMEKFIQENKTILTERALESIEYGITNNLPFVEVFNFKNTDFVITISSKDFLLNVDHIYKLYLESENYELCPRVVRLQSVLKNKNPNEKETEIHRIE